jgi:PAS domain S-box-containing protein
MSQTELSAVADIPASPPQDRGGAPGESECVLLDERVAHSFRTFTATAGLIATGTGLTVLLGWTLGSEMMQAFIPGHTTMKANTAFCVVASGLALFVLQAHKLDRIRWSWIVRGLSLPSILIASATLLEYLLGRNFGIDELIFRDVTTVGTTYPGRTAPNTALSLLLIAVATLLLISVRPSLRYLAQKLAVVSGVLAALALLGYTFAISGLYGLGQHAKMALPAAIGLFLLSAGVACATVEHGFMRPLVSQGSGGMMLRRLLPLGVLVPWIVGFLVAEGSRWRIYGGDTDDMLFAIAVMVIFAIVLYANGRALNRVDADRERVQESLRSSSEQWQLTFDCMSEGLSYHDVDYRIVGSNSAFRNMLGGVEVLGQKCYHTVHCTEGPHDDCPMQKTLKTGKSEESEIYEPRLEKHLLVRTDPVKDSSGNVVRVVHVVEDITERKRAEENIRRLAAIVEQSFDAIFSADLNGKILSWNKAAEQIYGYSAAEAIGSTLSIFCPPEAPNEWTEIHSRIDQGKRVENVEKIRMRKDGSRFCASLTVSPMRDAHGTIIGSSATARDITEAKNAEQEIARRKIETERARAELGAVVDSMGEGLYQIDVQACIVFMNAAAERMLGYKLDDVRGRRMHDVIHAELPDGTPRPAHDCPLVKGVAKGEHHHEEEDFFKRKDGTFFPVEYTSSPLIVEKQVAGSVVSFRDISERKRSEEERARLLELERQARREIEARKAEIEQLNEELEQRVRLRTLELEVSNKELEAFSYSVSHDLRAPLRSLDGFSHILLDEYAEKFDEEGRDFLRRLRNASQTMGQLIDALLQLSRVTRSDMTRERVDLTMIARQITTELQNSAPERNVRFEIAEGLSATGDPRLVHVVLQNLLGNAWKFTARREQALIEFGIGQHEGAPAFFVRDNGAGFDMNYRNKLFGAFQRLHTASEFEGSGIGLATVHRIVRRHGGMVWAVGAPDQGATFYFTLS